MNRMTILLAAMAMNCGIALAQDSFVSAPLVKALESGKFYMKLSASQAVEDAELDLGSVSITVELASRGGVSMSRTHSQMADGVVLTTAQGSYLLDEQAKTWKSQPGAGAFTGGQLRFIRQGSCRINGEEGWFFDEYRAGDGSSFTFYYNSDKVSVVELASPDGEGFGAMNLQSFSTFIPSNMYFCVGNDWKEETGGGMGDALSMAGIDRASIEAEIRESLKGEELPPGMSVDDMVKMALGSMGSATGTPAKPAKKSLFPAPPKCTKPWTDTGTANDLAGGGSFSAITITDRQDVPSPVYASSLSSASSTSKKKHGLRTDRNVTSEGIRAAMEYFMAENQGKTGKEIENNILGFNKQAAGAMAAGTVTGPLVEMAIAECKLYPHPSLLTTTGSLLLEIEDPETAAGYFEEASKLQPDFAGPYYGQIECALDMGDLPKARKIVPKILEMTPQGLQDGRAWLYKAMLEDKNDSPYKAVDYLFKSMSFGYFDENSVLLLNSLLTELDVAQMRAAESGGDFQNILESVFTDENLTNLRKAITWSRNEKFVSNEADFSFTSPASLEGNREMNRRYASEYEAKGDKAWDKSQKAIDASPGVSICEAMALDGLADNIQELFDAAKDLPSSKKAAAESAQARKSMGKLNISSSARSTLSKGYRLATFALRKKYKVDGFYIPDDRTFWSLYTLDRYYHWRMAYVQGGFGTYDEDNNTFSGVLPEALKNWYRNNHATKEKYEALDKEMAERQNKAELALLERIAKQTAAWDEAHPDAPTEVWERAHKRIGRPAVIMMMYTHPMERLEQLKIPSAQEEMRHQEECFNKLMRPLLNEWWADISKHALYCLDPNIAKYFWFKTLSEIYGIVEGTYSDKASEGENIAWQREELEKVLAKIKEEEWQDRQAAAADFQQRMAEARDEQEFPDRKLYGFNELTLDIGLPFGDLRLGIVDGDWGFKVDMDLPDVIIRPEPLNSVTVDPMKPKPYFDNSMLNFIQNLVGKGMDAFHGDFYKRVGMDAPDSHYWDVISAAVRASQGKLVDVKDEQRHYMYVDSAGNLRRREVNSHTVDVGGYFKWTRQDIQIGSVKRRKDLVTISKGGFFSVTGGSYSPRHR